MLALLLLIAALADAPAGSEAAGLATTALPRAWPDLNLNLTLLTQCEALECQGSELDAESGAGTVCSPECQCGPEDEDEDEDDATASPDDPPTRRPACARPPAPTLHCHEHDTLSVTWESPDLPDDNVYLIEVDDGDTTWTTVNITHLQIGVVRGLQPNSSYRVRVRALGPRGPRCVSPASEWLWTTPGESYVPTPPTAVWLESIDYGPDSAQAHIAWSVDEADPACQYYLVAGSQDHHEFPRESEPKVYETAHRYTVRNLRLDQRYIAKLYSYSANRDRYTDAVDKNFTFRTEPCLDYSDDECYPAKVRDLTLSVDHVAVTSPVPRSQLNDAVLTLNLTVRWAVPVVRPDNYTVMVSAVGMRHANLTIVPGNANGTWTTRLDVLSPFNVEMWGVVAGRRGPSGLATCTVDDAAIEEANDVALAEEEARKPADLPGQESVRADQTVVILVSVLVPVAVVVAAVVALSLRRFCCDKDERHPTKHEYGAIIVEKAVGMSAALMAAGCAPSELADGPPGCVSVSLLGGLAALEGCLIPASSLALAESLGSGCFGVVCRAALTHEDGRVEPVAVKMLHDGASEEDRRHFVHEIAVLRSVGQHKNVVSMVGCCVEGRTLLVVEYCALGDLQRYLREVAKAMSEDAEQHLSSVNLDHTDSTDSDFEQQSESEHEQEPSLGLVNFVSNAMYELAPRMDGETARLREPRQGSSSSSSSSSGCSSGSNSSLPLRLGTKDLLGMACQVATGMEYLAGMKVVHRDLAARNVLVCGDRTVKISDFGLSRDVYEESVYRQSGKDPVPVKWMAIESLLRREYTTQSDVWSFGVLLWEIMTFGEAPYATLNGIELIDSLKGGYRMERPANCSHELYQEMQQCWQEKPWKRPTFATLRKRLDSLLETAASSDGARYLTLSS